MGGRGDKQRGRGQTEEHLLSVDTYLVWGCCKGQGLRQLGLKNWGAGEGVGVQAGRLREGWGPGGHLEEGWWSLGEV